MFDGNLGRRGAQMACLSTSDCPCVAVFISRSAVLRLFNLIFLCRGGTDRYVSRQAKEQDLTSTKYFLYILNVHLLLLLLCACEDH